MLCNDRRQQGSGSVDYDDAQIQMARGIDRTHARTILKRENLLRLEIGLEVYTEGWSGGVNAVLAAMAHVAIYEELSSAVAQLNARGLATASKWAAEQLIGLEEEVQAAGAAALETAGPPARHPDLHNPRYLLAKSHFEFRVRGEGSRGGRGGRRATMHACRHLHADSCMGHARDNASLLGGCQAK